MPPTKPLQPPLQHDITKMINCFETQEHPDTVFNTRGDREDSLSRSALEMLAAFEALLAFLVQPAASAVRWDRS